MIIICRKILKVQFICIILSDSKGYTCKSKIRITRSTTVSVNQNVTITLSGVEAPGHGYSASNTWAKISGPDFTTVSGGKKEDKTWTIKFTGIGTATIQCNADFCRHSSCEGAKTAQTTITVQ